MTRQHFQRGFWFICMILISIGIQQLLNIGTLLSLPEAVRAHISLSLPLEMGIGVLFISLVIVIVYQLFRMRGRVGQPRWMNRARWLMIGYLVWVGTRLTIFAQADYDRNRLLFLWILIGGISLVLFVQNIRYTAPQSPPNTGNVEQVKNEN